MNQKHRTPLRRPGYFVVSYSLRKAGKLTGLSRSILFSDRMTFSVTGKRQYGQNDSHKS